MKMESRVIKTFFKQEIDGLKLWKWSLTQRNVLQTGNCKSETIKTGPESTKRFPNKKLLETIKTKPRVNKTFCSQDIVSRKLWKGMQSESTKSFTNKKLSLRYYENGVRVIKTFCKRESVSLKPCKWGQRKKVLQTRNLEKGEMVYINKHFADKILSVWNLENGISQQNILKTRNCISETLKMGSASKTFCRQTLSVWNWARVNKRFQIRNHQSEALKMVSGSAKRFTDSFQFH